MLYILDCISISIFVSASVNLFIPLLQKYDYFYLKNIFFRFGARIHSSKKCAIAITTYSTSHPLVTCSQINGAELQIA